MTETTDASRVPATPSARTGGAPVPHNVWRIIALLAAANVLNIYDRTIPAILVEPLKSEFDLTDTHIGIMSGAFTVVVAVIAIAMGRVADRTQRRKVMGFGLIVWSIFTAASGGAWSFATLLIARLGVGVGEAAFTPAGTAMISDLVPSERRSRAISIFQLGVPLGITLAFFTVGAFAEAFDSWRAPFVIAAIPGLFLGLLMLRIPEPRRGASDGLVRSTPVRDSGAFRELLSTPTIWWIIVSGIGIQIATYGVTSFLVAYEQRYFGMELEEAAVSVGFVIGVTGILGLLVGGVIADRASRRSSRLRVLLGAVALTCAAPLAFAAFNLGPESPGAFVLILGAAWLLQSFYFVVVYPALAEVAAPHQRATAVAIFGGFAYLLGGGTGPVIAGILSDRFAAGATDPVLSAEAVGLQGSLLIIAPVAMLICATGLYGASRTITRDAGRVREAIARSQSSR